MPVISFLRKERDSNPRYLSVRRFSRPLQSTTLPSFHNVPSLQDCRSPPEKRCKVMSFCPIFQTSVYVFCLSGINNVIVNTIITTYIRTSGGRTLLSTLVCHALCTGTHPLAVLIKHDIPATFLHHLLQHFMPPQHHISVT